MPHALLDDGLHLLRDPSLADLFQGEHRQPIVITNAISWVDQHDSLQAGHLVPCFENAIKLLGSSGDDDPNSSISDDVDDLVGS